MQNLRQYLILCALAIWSTHSLAADKKTVSIVTDPTFAPFEFMDKNTDKLVGFDIDLIKAICEVEGVEPVITTEPFDAHFPALITHQTEIAISGFSITEERAQIVKFSEPYYETGLCPLISEQDVNKIKSKEDLHDLTFCVQLGTTGEEYTQKINGANLKHYNTADESFEALEKGECQVAINDKPIIEYYINANHKKNLKILDIMLTTEQYGIVTALDNDEISNMVSSGLKKVKENGTLKKIYTKWFESDTFKK